MDKTWSVAVFLLNTHHLVAGSQFEQQSSVFMQVFYGQVKEMCQNIRQGQTLFRTFRQLLYNLGPFAKHITSNRSDRESQYTC